MRWGSMPSPRFSCSLWHVRNSLPMKGAFLVASSRSLYEQNWLVWVEVVTCPLLGLPLEIGPFSCFCSKKRIKPSTWGYQHKHLKCLYLRCSKQLLLFTLKSPSYLYPGSYLGVTWVWTSWKGGAKYGNSPEPSWREKSAQHSIFRRVSSK